MYHLWKLSSLTEVIYVKTQEASQNTDLDMRYMILRILKNKGNLKTELQARLQILSQNRKDLRT